MIGGRNDTAVPGSIPDALHNPYIREGSMGKKKQKKVQPAPAGTIVADQAQAGKREPLIPRLCKHRLGSYSGGRW